MVKRLLGTMAAVSAGALLLASCSSGPGGSASPTTTGSGSGGSKAPITIGYITSLTGVSSSTFADGAAGAQARIDAQNAVGGIDGHKLKLVVEDDQSSPSTNATASKDLVQNKGAFGVINFSAFTFGGAPYLSSAGVPLTGSDFDGPEWTEPTSTNMFSYTPPTYAPFDGKYYGYDAGLAQFLKKQGVTKMAGLSYGISPSAQRSSNQLLEALKRIGVPTCYNNTSVPFGAVDFTAAALSIKSAGCDGVEAPFVDSSDIALSAAVKNAGIKAVQFYFTGYDQTVLNDPAALHALDGAYISAPLNFTTPTGPTKAMLDTIAKYDPKFHKGDIPDLGLYGSYLSADLMIYGLEHAGKNPTQKSFITNLRKVTNYDAGGILPSPVSFANFGTVKMLPKQSCGYIVQLKAPTFVVANGGKQVCSPLASY